MNNTAPWVVCIASFNADLVCRVARPPTRGETLLAHGFDLQPGGKGSNAAVACARQGARVAVVARLGDDEFASLARRLWAREGIDASAVEIAAAEHTGVAQIQVFDDGDNSIVVAPGAGAGLGAGQVRAPAAAAHLRRARVVISSCEVPFAATEAAFALAREAGATTLLNPAPALPVPASIWRLTDIATPNEHELVALAEGHSADLVQAAGHLLARGPRAVLVTLGARGALLVRADAPPLALAGHAAQVVDTIGAGDTFTGALAAALARGEPIEQAARWANAAAALSVTGRGAIGAMPSHDAVAAALSLSE